MGSKLCVSELEEKCASLYEQKHHMISELGSTCVENTRNKWKNGDEGDNGTEARKDATALVEPIAKAV